MFPFFHVFIPLILLESILYFYPKSKNWNIIRFWIILGSILPDLIDKPLSLLFPDIFAGRGIAHAPLVIIGFLISIHIIFKKKYLTKNLGIGILLHLLLDLPSLPWFWPFIPLDLHSFDIIGWWITLTTNMWVLSTEIISLLGIVGIAIRYHLLDIKKVINWENFQDFLIKQPSYIAPLEQKKIK